MIPTRSKGALLFLLLLGLLGMGFRPGVSDGSESLKLKAEIRLKYYSQALRHYEEAERLAKARKRVEALRKLQKATKVVSAFPEAYELARRIHLELGNPKEAEKAEALFRQHEGHLGASLSRVRQKLIQEVARRKKFALPPDLEPLSTFLLSALVVGILIGGMIYEYRRLTQRPDQELESGGLLLERFPDEEFEVATTTWFFKGCALVLPAPFLFSILVLLGLRHSSELLPPFFFSWALVAGAVYLIFFADLSDLGGFRRPGGGV